MFPSVTVMACCATLTGSPRCECVPDVKVTTTVVHDAKSVEYCSPRWALGDCVFGRSPTPGECGRLRTKNVLLKFTRKCEEPTMKCQPVGCRPVP